MRMHDTFDDTVLFFYQVKIVTIHKKNLKTSFFLFAF